MKKSLVIFSVLVLMFSMTFVSAGFFDWLTGDAIKETRGDLDIEVEAPLVEEENDVTLSKVSGDDLNGDTEWVVTFPTKTIYWKPICMDLDNDGYGTNCLLGPDCNDNESNINPGVSEVCGNSVDDDCDGSVDEGCIISLAPTVSLAPRTPVLDKPVCIDSTGLNPNNQERVISAEGEVFIDNCINNDTAVYEYFCNEQGEVAGQIFNCSNGCVDGACDVCTDLDGDGYFMEGGECGSIDCDDNNSMFYPDATELCDGIDNNCNKIVDEDCVNCVDSDSESDNPNYERGTLVWMFEGSSMTDVDFCSGDTLTEFECVGGISDSKTFICLNGCVDGACLTGDEGKSLLAKRSSCSSDVINNRVNCILYKEDTAIATLGKISYSFKIEWISEYRVRLNVITSSYSARTNNIKMGASAKVPLNGESLQLLVEDINFDGGSVSYSFMLEERFTQDFTSCRLANGVEVSAGYTTNMEYCNAKGDMVRKEKAGVPVDFASTCRSHKLDANKLCTRLSFGEWFRNLFDN